MLFDSQIYFRPILHFDIEAIPLGNGKYDIIITLSIEVYFNVSQQSLCKTEHGINNKIVNWLKLTLNALQPI